MVTANSSLACVTALGLIAERSPLAEAPIGFFRRSKPLDTPEIPTPLPPSYKSGR